MNEEFLRARVADLEHVWHPFTQHSRWNDAEMLTIVDAEGFELIDHQGNRYIDGVSSLWVNPHGHRVPQIDIAISDQLARVAHTTFLGLSNIPASLLAQELIEVVPKGLSRVFFSDSGSEAVEIALKMAFQFHRQNGAPERDLFLSLGNAYHGDTIGSVSLGGIATFHRTFEPLLFSVVHAPTPFCYRCECRSNCDRRCFRALEEVFAANHSRLAAAVIEPRVQGAAGMIVHPAGYLAHFERLCREYGVFMIADEVATGFGRTGPMFACELEGVCPDMLCLGKCITGGYLPLAATVTTEKVFEGFTGDGSRTFFHGHSYTGNQLAAAAARASLALFRETDLLARIAENAKLIATGLEEFRSLPSVGDIRQQGMMVGIELVADRATRTPFEPSLMVGHRVIRRARELGAVIRPLGDVIVLMPSQAITASPLDRLLSIAYNAIAEAVPSS